MKKTVRDIVVVIFGNFLLAASVAFFVIPDEILSGGLAGIAVILKTLFNFKENIVIDVCVIATFILGALVLGKEFALKTALSSVIYPVFLEILIRIPLDIEIDKLLSCGFGGVLAGIGIGLVFKHDASTGGIDVPCIIVSKYSGMELSLVVMIADALVCILGLVAYGLEDVLYGIVYIALSSYAINRVMIPKTDEAVALYIISSKTEEICEYIHVDLYRGTTILEAKGGYTNESKNVVLTVVSKNQYSNLSNFVEKIDPFAFIIVSDAKEIKGEGFTYEYRV